MIARRSARELRNLGARAVLIVLAIAIAAGTGGGASLASTNVEGALDSFYSNYHLPGLEMSLKELRPRAELMARARRAGATRASTRLVVPGTINLRPGVAAALLVGMQDDPSLNQLQVIEGKGVKELGKHGIVIEADFAHVHHLKIGSKVRLEAAGFHAPARVEGIGRTPDSLFASASPEYFVLQRGTLAYVYAPLEEVQAAAAGFGGEVEGGVDELLVNLPADGRATRERILTHGLPVDQVIPRRQQNGYRGTRLNLSELSAFTPVLAAVLATVAILLIGVTMMRLVRSQRRELGTMLALGQRRSTVILTAVTPALTLGFLGGLLAIPACVAVAKLMATQFTSSYGFLSVPTRLTFGAAATSFALAVVTSLVAAIFPAVALSRLAPAEALRGDIPSSNRLPGWARSLTAGAGAASAYGLRNVLRTPVRSALTVISLGGAIGLGISLHIVASSVEQTNNDWFAKQAWTQQAVLQEPLPLRQAILVGRHANARKVQPLTSGSVGFSSGKRALGSVNAVGATPAPQLTSIGLPPGGVKPGTTYVSKQVETQYGLKVGQYLRLAGSHGSARVLIAGTANTLAEQDAYLPLGVAQRLLGQQGKITSILVEGGPATATALRKSLRVSKVISKATVKSGISEVVSQLTLLMNTVVALGLAVGALFLISSLAMSILERQTEFAVLRALGWGFRDLAAIVVIESLVLTALGGLVGSLLAPVIASPLMTRINSAWFHVSYDLGVTNFLVVVAPALVLAALVALQASRRISTLDVGRAVRTRVAG
jgi:putative ABC transport system permease protein